MLRYMTILLPGKSHLSRKHLGSNRLTLVEGDLKDRAQLVEASRGQGSVYHFASNPDIARAIAQPDVNADFDGLGLRRLCGR